MFQKTDHGSSQQFDEKNEKLGGAGTTLTWHDIPHSTCGFIDIRKWKIKMFNKSDKCLTFDQGIWDLLTLVN